MFRGSTKDTGEDFDNVIADWDGDVLTPFNEFLQRVYRAYSAIFSAFKRLIFASSS
jgi:hypothetical protein